MHLQGWEKPLPDWLVEAVLSGTVKVIYDPKLKCQLLQGEVVHPNGSVSSWK